VSKLADLRVMHVMLKCASMMLSYTEKTRPTGQGMTMHSPKLTQAPWMADCVRRVRMMKTWVELL